MTTETTGTQVRFAFLEMFMGKAQLFMRRKFLHSSDLKGIFLKHQNCQAGSVVGRFLSGLRKTRLLHWVT